MIDTVVDGGSGYAEPSGNWGASGVKGANNTATRYSNTAGATATWTPTLAPGYYTVTFYNVVASNSSSSAQVNVVANGTSTSQTISQATGTSGFIALGTFYFAGTGGEKVTLKNLGSGSLRSDEVVFTAAPVITVVDGGSGYAETSGNWAASGLKGANNTATRYSNTAGATATWTPTLAPGYYTVTFYNVVASNSSTSAQVNVVANGTTTSRTINQATGNQRLHHPGNVLLRRNRWRESDAQESQFRKSTLRRSRVHRRNWLDDGRSSFVQRVMAEKARPPSQLLGC